jgi:hypothetical protein
MDQEDTGNSLPTTPEKEQGQQLSKSEGSAGSETDDNSEDDEDSPNESNHQVQSWLADRMRKSKFCNYCQDCVDSFSRLLKCGPFRLLEAPRIPAPRQICSPRL